MAVDSTYAEDPSKGQGQGQGAAEAGPTGAGAVAVGLPQAGTKQEEISYKDTQIADKQRALPADSVTENVAQGKDVEMQVRSRHPFCFAAAWDLRRKDVIAEG